MIGVINYYLYDELNITALQGAILNNNIEIVKLLLSKEKLDVNVLYIKIIETREYSNCTDFYGKYNLPCNDFDIKIPDMKIRDSLLINEVDRSIFLSLSNLDRIKGQLDINHYKVEKTSLIISIENKNDEIAQISILR